jgi:hypothetical protein
LFSIVKKILINFITIEAFDFEEYSCDCADTNALFHHRFIEACKFAFGLRCFVGDDNFTDSTEVNIN